VFIFHVKQNRAYKNMTICTSFSLSFDWQIGLVSIKGGGDDDDDVDEIELLCSIIGVDGCSTNESQIVQKYEIAAYRCRYSRL